VYIWGTAGGFEKLVGLYVSPQIERILGFKPEEWKADPDLWIERLHPDDREDVLDETTRAVDAGEPFTMDYRVVAKDGHVVWLHDHAAVLSRDDEGRVTRYHGIQIDVSAQREAEAEQRRSLDLLGIIDKQRRRLLARLVTTQEDERRRIAEDLHDDTLQGLFAIQMGLATFAKGHPEIAREMGLPRLRRQMADSIARLRRLAFDLHPSILDSKGLVAALRAHVKDIESPSSRAYTLEDRLRSEPSRETRAILYRIAQEALANIRKHSRSTRVVLSFKEREDGYHLRIKDNGVGFDPATSGGDGTDHVGINSIRERAEVAGGWCRIESAPGSGTIIECWVPDGAMGTGGTDAEEFDLLTHIDTVASANGDATTQATQAMFQELTAREVEVARLLTLGHTNAEIGAILFLSVRTVEHHRSNVFRKLGVRSRAGLVRWIRDHALQDKEMAG
jgi:PAS domain S-box-containing protein